MKKINKKGFTLIELLVVLVILSIIMVIAIPNITSSIERNKEKHKEQAENLAISAAEVYADDHRNSAYTSSVTNQCIDIQTLIDEGYITKDAVKDPFNETEKVCKKLQKNGNTYNCVEQC